MASLFRSGNVLKMAILGCPWVPTHATQTRDSGSASIINGIWASSRCSVWAIYLGDPDPRNTRNTGYPRIRGLRTPGSDPWDLDLTLFWTPFGGLSHYPASGADRRWCPLGQRAIWVLFGVWFRTCCGTGPDLFRRSRGGIQSTPFQYISGLFNTYQNHPKWPFRQSPDLAPWRVSGIYCHWMG